MRPSAGWWLLRSISENTRSNMNFTFGAQGAEMLNAFISLAWKFYSSGIGIMSVYLSILTGDNKSGLCYTLFIRQ